MKLYWHLIAVLMALAILSGGRSTAANAAENAFGKISPGTHVFEVSVSGAARRYVVHIPPSYNVAVNWPIVIMFHGGGGTAKAAMWETGWAGKADKEGFLAVFPEGTPLDPARPGRFRDNPQTWNDGSNRPEVGAAERDVRDVEFISAVLADLRGRFRVDEHRIYATGFSNGASMTFRLARELSVSIVAAAPVAGSDWLDGKTPERPIPILYITGTADPLNPIEGGDIHIGAKAFGRKPPIRKMISRWVKMHGYPEETRVVYDRDGVKGVAYGASSDTSGVVLYTIAGHGHYWPGGKSALPESLAGKNTARLSATEVIWEFFKVHPKR
ncbi:MAG: PHB depolymerase family esterase [Thermodesulfobacteriota bacterium]